MNGNLEGLTGPNDIPVCSPIFAYEPSGCILIQEMSLTSISNTVPSLDVIQVTSLYL
jgi:hypothetical protein